MLKAGGANNESQNKDPDMGLNSHLSPYHKLCFYRELSSAGQYLCTGRGEYQSGAE